MGEQKAAVAYFSFFFYNFCTSYHEMGIQANRKKVKYSGDEQEKKNILPLNHKIMIMTIYLNVLMELRMQERG